MHFCYFKGCEYTLFIGHTFNPIALRNAKTVYNFGLSGCNRVTIVTGNTILCFSFSFRGPRILLDSYQLLKKKVTSR